MEPATTLDPTVRASPAALLREPLSWAALTAFVGSAVGLAGTFAWTAWERSLGGYEPLGPTPLPPLLASWGAPSGGILAALSLLGVALLLGRRSWAAWVGVTLLLLWLAASLSFVLYSSLRPPEPNFTGAPPFAFLVLGHASIWMGSAAVLPLALGALFVARKRRLGMVLLALSVPGMFIVPLYVPRVGVDISLSEITALVGSLSFPGVGVGVPEAVLWVSLGVLLLGEARLRALSKLRQSIVRENAQKARRLYEDGLGARQARHGALHHGLVGELSRSFGLGGVPGGRGRPGQDTPLPLRHRPGQRDDVVPADRSKRWLQGRVRRPLQGRQTPRSCSGNLALRIGAPGKGTKLRRRYCRREDLPLCGRVTETLLSCVGGMRLAGYRGPLGVNNYERGAVYIVSPGRG